MENEQISFISKNFKKNFLFSRIVETEEQYNYLKTNKENFWEYIHCSGCHVKCSLASPCCGRGIGTKKKLEGE